MELLTSVQNLIFKKGFTNIENYNYEKKQEAPTIDYLYVEIEFRIVMEIYNILQTAYLFL